MANWYIYDGKEWNDPIDCDDYWDFNLDDYKGILLNWDYSDIESKEVYYIVEYRKWVARSYKETIYIPFIFNKCNLILTYED